MLPPLVPLLLTLLPAFLPLLLPLRLLVIMEVVLVVNRASDLKKRNMHVKIIVKLKGAAEIKCRHTSLNYQTWCLRVTP